MFSVLQYHAKVRFMVNQMVQHSGNGRSKFNFKSLDKLMRNGRSLPFSLSVKILYFHDNNLSEKL